MSVLDPNPAGDAELEVVAWVASLHHKTGYISSYFSRQRSRKGSNILFKYDLRSNHQLWM